MPIYEYVCKECGSKFERMVRLSEADKRPECPRCGSDQTNKQLSTIASRLAPQGAGAAASSGSSCSSSGSPFR
jgi:putative FmdB family regulatory protein